jgi:hypothetical protein
MHRPDDQPLSQNHIFMPGHNQLKGTYFTTRCDDVLPFKTTSKWTLESQLHPAQFTFYTDAWVVASWQLAQSVLFPPPPRVGKLGNDLAPQGPVRRKCSLVLICSFRKQLRHKPGNTWFKVSGALFRCYFKGACIMLLVHLAHTLCFSHLPSHTILGNYLGKNS